MPPLQTYIGTFGAPDPLSIVPLRTLSTLPSLSALTNEFVGRIEGVLAEYRIQSPDSGDLTTARRLRANTHLEVEPRPLDGVRPRVQHVERSSRMVHLDSALTELQRWLGVGLVEVVAAAGISRGTVYAWRVRDSRPRPATVSSILRVHGLVRSAVATVGQEDAREYFHSGDPSPWKQLVSAGGDAAAMSRVSRTLRRDLTGPALPAPNRMLEATFDDRPSQPLV